MFDENVEHHEARAKYWMEQGKPEYAAGSLAKAEKWRQRSIKLTPPSLGTTIDRLLELIGESYEESLERSMLHGNSRQGFEGFLQSRKTALHR